MKKRLAAILIAGSMLGVGGGLFSAHAAVGGECAGPVSVNCTITNDDGTQTPCTLYVNTDATGVICQ
ncbi:MAG: hypothetical protein ABR552_06755 [Actinomycetota bacterium]